MTPANLKPENDIDDKVRLERKKELIDAYFKDVSVSAGEKMAGSSPHAPPPIPDFRFYCEKCKYCYFAIEVSWELRNVTSSQTANDPKLENIPKCPKHGTDLKRIDVQSISKILLSYAGG